MTHDTDVVPVARAIRTTPPAAQKAPAILVPGWPVAG